MPRTTAGILGIFGTNVNEYNTVKTKLVLIFRLLGTTHSLLTLMLIIVLILTKIIVKKTNTSTYSYTADTNTNVNSTENTTNTIFKTNTITYETRVSLLLILITLRILGLSEILMKILILKLLRMVETFFVFLFF